MDTMGATVPSWNLMAIQVEPQITTVMVYSSRLLIGSARRKARTLAHPRARAYAGGEHRCDINA